MGSIEGTNKSRDGCLQGKGVKGNIDGTKEDRDRVLEVKGKKRVGISG